MMDEIDYKIHRSTMDLVEIELDPGEAVIIETGAMISMDDNIHMTAVVGDGSQKERGVLSRLIGSGKRAITGEGFFMTKLENVGRGKGRVLLSPGGTGAKVISLNLAKLGGKFLCNKGHFLAAARGINIGMAIRFKPLTAIVGSAELVMHELTGGGRSFLKSNGPVYKRLLGDGEKINIDQHSLVGMSDTVRYSIRLVKGVKSMLFSGEGMVLYQLEGPGVVVLQGYNTEDSIRDNKRYHRR